VLTGLPLGQDLTPPPTELLLQIGEKRHRLRGENPPFDFAVPKLIHKSAASLLIEYSSKQTSTNIGSSFVKEGI
jgi:hypothetical protein